MEEETNKGVYFFSTTNLFSKIEPAIKRRCYGLFIGYPKTKEAIASIYLDNLANFENTVSDETIETLATANDKFLSPSVIASIVKLASTLANTNDKIRRVKNHLYIQDPNGPYTFADVSKDEEKPITKQILEIVPINDNHLINARRVIPSAITAGELERYKDEAKELLQLDRGHTVVPIVVFLRPLLNWLVIVPCRLRPLLEDEPVQFCLRPNNYPPDIIIEKFIDCDVTEMIECDVNNQMACFSCKQLNASCIHFERDMTLRLSRDKSVVTLKANRDAAKGYDIKKEIIHLKVFLILKQTIPS
ncbi:unnamed protein product [Ceutorhynchus assimilis]|uniref:Uncharacterized protein n=1 Tax=Ceutorhynchus assimilis TaxID=467358 RepID=A0A9N9QNS1_9CUCU|nr:unnamed protein product [Ceutorhynchus assimilis]